MNSSLLNSMLTTPSGQTSATRLADEARASTARAQSAKAEMGGQFSELLRGYDKPVDKPPEGPKPAAAAPPKSEGRTETQRQEARIATPKKSAEPPASAAATRTVNEGSESAAEAALLETGAVEEKPAARKDDAANPPSALAALLAPSTPLPLALPVGAAKPQGPGFAPEDGAQMNDGKSNASTGASTSTNSGTNSGSSTPLGRAAQAAAEDIKAKASDASTQDSAAQSSAANFTTALADAVQAQPAALRNAEAGPHKHREGPSLEGIASASAQAPQSSLSPASADIGSTARVTVASPLYTPGFAPEMAARLSVLAADGVQTAQLHLNPADMGPVTVKIVVEGLQARIEFQADQADTRAVLERSLPDLAAALRDSGLTLSGGGVFQQFAGQDPSGARARSDGQVPRRSGTDDADNMPSVPTLAVAVGRQTQGVVDLYA